MGKVVDESEFQRAKSFWQTRATRSASQTQDSCPPPVLQQQQQTSADGVKRRSSSSANVEREISSSSNAASPPASPPASKAKASSSSSFAKRIAPFANAKAVAQVTIPPAFAGAASAVPTATTAAAAANDGAKTNFRPSVVPDRSAVVTESPATPAPDHTMPPTPSPSIHPAKPTTVVTTVTTTAPTTVVNSMFKSLSDAKQLFGNAEAPKESKDASPSSSSSTAQMTLPGLQVQLPDMSSWKEKMKSYGNKSKASGASMRSLSFANISSSWKSMSTGSTTSSDNGNSPTKGSSPSAAGSAKLNIHNPSQGRAKTSSNPLTTGSPYGELIVAEVLAARDLAVGDFIQGESDPYVSVRFEDKEKHSAVSKGTLNPVYNERFVFWVPSSPAIDEKVVSITVMNRNMVIPDEHLGEVHIALALPVNEAFDEWYPLVKEDGTKKGSVRIGVRRMVLTSPSLLLAAQSLAAQERSLNDNDLRTHGSTIPELWYGFAEAQEPVFDDGSKPKQSDAIASKLNHFSRRFIGIELTSLGDSSSRRDVF